MAKNYIDFKKIKRLSKTDKDVPFANKILKLSEETGEVAQASLKYLGSANTSKSTDGVDARELVLEEVCDVLNVAVDIINSLGFSSKEVKLMFDKKLNKWEAKTLLYKTN